MPEVLPISYPPELPVTAAKEEISAAIRDHQVVIVAGATGSGKTTQLPKICLELGRKRVAHTQPRRLAARTIAERIASELDVELGGLVGYQVRFGDHTSRATRIKLMTDGILLAEIHRDRDLGHYDTIILDEAHERSLNVDFLIGYLSTVLKRRPELKLIITSATIDPGSFAKHFEGILGAPVPIIEVSGRTFPVEIRYRPLIADDADEESDSGEDTGQRGSGLRGSGGRDADARDSVQGIVDAVAELGREPRGDVLVFLSGENEIRDAREALEGTVNASTEVIPLYGRLSARDQHRAFEPPLPGIIRRIVLSTNVAETSLTVPGIKYVIDTGTARISRYSTRSKVQRLPIEPISKASANQRSGRAGRTSDGIAIRLYAEVDFERRSEYTDPEVLRTSLASVILHMAALGLGDIESFPFLTPPVRRDVRAGLELLHELGALEVEGAESAGKKGQAGKATEAAQAGPRLTRLGKRLARLPIDPRYARMLLEAQRQNTLEPVAAIVAGLTVQDVRERPLEFRAQADQQHARFTDRKSDFITLLKLWYYLQAKRQELSGSAFRRLCKREYLNYLRVREWQDLYRQLLGMLTERSRGRDDSGRDDSGWGDGGKVNAAKSGGSKADAAARTDHIRKKSNGPDSGGGNAQGSTINEDGIHRAILSGLLSQLGIWDPQKKDYAGSRGSRFVIFPGSTLAKQPPRAVMSAELVETSRLFARSNAQIDPAWAETLARPLCKYSYSEPHWSTRRGGAAAYEKVTLYGVVLVERRQVSYGRIDPEQARELFIRHALLEHETQQPSDDPNQHPGGRLSGGNRVASSGQRNLGQRHPGRQRLGHKDGTLPSQASPKLWSFLQANRRLATKLAEVEERTRRRDILAGDETLYAFYDERIPATVTDVASFEKWWRAEKVERPQLLEMHASDLLDGAGKLDEELYPSSWSQGDQRLAIGYRFEPGTPDDGVSVQVPLALLPRLSETGFDWQVPGLRLELATALIKALPKAIRRNVVPAADWAKKLLGDLPAEAADTSFLEVFAAAIARAASMPVTAADFELERVPAHLKPTFRVLDERGKTVGSGKDLAQLQQTLAGAATRSVAEATRGTRLHGKSKLERSNLKTWDFGDLPHHVDTDAGSGTVRAYPGLVDVGDSVAIQLAATETERDRAHAAGVRRLLLLQARSPVSYVQEHLKSDEKLLLASSPYQNVAALFEDALAAAAEDALIQAGGASLTETSFRRAADAFNAGLIDTLFATVATVTRALAEARDARKALKAASHINLLAALSDAAAQIDALIYPGFIGAMGLRQLARLPVYLRGVTARVARLVDNPGRDRAWSLEVATATERYLAAGGALPLPALSKKLFDTRLVQVRWMLEELRLSLYAQELGTAGPVSLKRINRALAET